MSVVHPSAPKGTIQYPALWRKKLLYWKEEFKKLGDGSSCQSLKEDTCGSSEVGGTSCSSKFERGTQSLQQEVFLLKLQVLETPSQKNGGEIHMACTEMKTELKNEVAEMINGAKAEWEALNNSTRTDVATLKHLLDTDECNEMSHNCSSDASCIDTRVSFRCKCKPGFTGDGYTCEDIDECTERFRCGPHATCKNTPGKYTCSCDAGFQGDGKDCEDIDECALGSHKCHKYAVCSNTVGSYTCHCTLYHEGDGINCHEVDIASCASPFEPVRGVGCIHIIEKSQSYETSRRGCQKLGGDLFVAINSEHYLRLAKHFIDTNQASKKKYMWVGVKEGVWLSGRKVAPEEEAPRNPTMDSGTCSYTDGDTSEKFLLWTDPCSTDWWALCEKKI